MNPVRYDLIQKKREIVLQQAKLLQRLQKENITNTSDDILKHALCHSMQIAISAVIDTAQHILSEKHIKFDSYSEAIEKLGECGVLDRDFAAKFSSVAKLRNVLVHLYDDVNFGFLASMIPQLIKDMKKFDKELKA